jgi:PPE-repeat protein
MWAQDAAAMYGYAGSSASAARLSPLTSPAPATAPGGLGAQAAAVSQAAASSAPTSGLHGMVANLPNAVQSFAAPAAAAADPPSLSTLENVLTGGVLNNVLANNLVANVGNAAFDVGSWNGFNAIVSGVLYQHTVGAIPGGAAAGGAAAVSASVGTGARASGPMLVSMGSAASAGSLSVPETWAVAAPAAQPATLTGSEWAAGEDQTTVASGMPAVASAGRGGYAVGPRYGVKPKVMPTQVFV